MSEAPGRNSTYYVMTCEGVYPAAVVRRVTELAGPAGAKLPIKFGKTDAVIVGSAPGSVPTALDPNPKANLKFDMGTSTAANIFLGGTVTPAGNQAPGSYVATVVLTVTIQ